eukprot:4678493-Prymnesium_polylepis.1
MAPSSRGLRRSRWVECAHECLGAVPLGSRAFRCGELTSVPPPCDRGRRASRGSAAVRRARSRAALSISIARRSRSTSRGPSSLRARTPRTRRSRCAGWPGADVHATHAHVHVPST